MPLPTKPLALCTFFALSIHIAAADDKLTRVAAVQIKAEITGLFLGTDGELFMNAQHPSRSNPAPHNKANITMIPNADFSAEELPVPLGKDKGVISTTLGEVSILASGGDFGGRLGVIKDVHGDVLFKTNDPDFNALVPVDDHNAYLFTNWENRPGGMSRMTLEKRAGKWLAVDMIMVDFSAVKGTWTNCFGTLSPWGTPLTSEELYFKHTKNWNNKNSENFSGQNNLQKHIGRFPNPYRYGYIVEINDPKGNPTPRKKFALGRFSHENAVVMPDEKTVYLSDDGGRTVFFKFVADKKQDLSSGTLYSAKVTQENGRDSAKTGFSVKWIELAHANENDVESWIREYDGIDPSHYKEGSTSYISDREITAWARGDAKDDRVAYLESRKAAAAKGATMEFRKMEGVVANPAVPGKVFMAMSAINNGMSDQEGDIQLTQNNCGVVYEMDTDAAHSITRMTPLVAGRGYDENALDNRCSVESIANPDNLLVLDNGDVVIGEDSNNHENNMLWVYSRQ